MKKEVQRQSWTQAEIQTAIAKAVEGETEGPNKEYWTTDCTVNDIKTKFGTELEKTIQRTQDPAHRQVRERLRGFDWMGYIAASVRHAGYRDQREVQERTHDVVVTFLTGTLFRGFDEHESGPMDSPLSEEPLPMPYGISSRRRRTGEQTLAAVRLPRSEIPAGRYCLRPGLDEKGSSTIFAGSSANASGLGVTVLDARLAGGETKSLVGLASLGSPGRWTVKEGRLPDQGAGEGVCLVRRS